MTAWKDWKDRELVIRTVLSRWRKTVRARLLHGVFATWCAQPAPSPLALAVTIQASSKCGLARLHGTLNARSGLHSSAMLEKDAAMEEQAAALAVAEATNAKLAAELQRVRSRLNSNRMPSVCVANCKRGWVR